MMVPGLKVVAPATPADVKGLLKAAIRDDDPVVFFEHKGLYGTKGEVPDDDYVIPLGQAEVRREGGDVTIVALAGMVPKALEAAEALAEDGIDAEVIDLRCLVPLDTQTIEESLYKTGRLMTVEENPRACGWGAEVASIVADEYFYFLDAPVRRVTTAMVPLPFAGNLEHEVIPQAETIRNAARELMQA